MSDKSDQLPQSKLEQLITGLLVLDAKHESEEAHYSAIGQQTFGHVVVGKRHAYASEIKRVLDEIHLTSALLQEVTELKETTKTKHEPEEIINYYAGIFLDHIHQLKDKLLRLIDYMAAADTQKRPYDEPDGIKVSKLLRKHTDVIDKMGIRELLQQWDQDSKTIGVVLRKRTQHHHFQSKLRQNKSFLDVQFSKTMLREPAVSQLNDAGKQRMAQIGADAYKKFRDDITTKQQLTIEEVEANIEAVADKLIGYYSIPTDPVKIAELMNNYMTFLSSLDIKNEASLSKVTPELKVMLDASVKELKDGGVPIKALYLVGSVARGEFVGGSSDINFYIITENYSRTFDTEMPVTLSVLSEEDFLSEKHQKDRFICWSDGVLVEGKEYAFKASDFPKPGTLLCLLLNEGFIERLEEIREEVMGLKKPTALDLRLFALKVARIEMDYDFGVSMSNQPFYSASRKQKIAHTKQVFPNESRTHILEQVYYGGRIKQDDFVVMIDAFLEGARKTYAKMLAVKKSIEVKQH